MYTIYGADKCPFCTKAKQLLDKYTISYKYIDVTGKKTEIMDNLKSKTNNQRTVPIIFSGNKFIGGYTELSNVILFDNIHDF